MQQRAACMRACFTNSQFDVGRSGTIADHAGAGPCSSCSVISIACMIDEIHLLGDAVAVVMNLLSSIHIHHTRRLSCPRRGISRCHWKIIREWTFIEEAATRPMDPTVASRRARPSGATILWKWWPPIAGRTAICALEHWNGHCVLRAACARSCRCSPSWSNTMVLTPM